MNSCLCSCAGTLRVLLTVMEQLRNVQRRSTLHVSGGDVCVHVASMLFDVALAALDDLQLEFDAARA